MACKRSAVRSRLSPPNRSQRFDRKMISRCGGIAQLGERLHGMQEVSGSIPLISTKSLFILNTFKKYLLKRNAVNCDFCRSKGRHFGDLITHHANYHQAVTACGCNCSTRKPCVPSRSSCATKPYSQSRYACITPASISVPSYGRR